MYLQAGSVTVRNVCMKVLLPHLSRGAAQELKNMTLLAFTGVGLGGKKEKRKKRKQTEFTPKSGFIFKAICARTYPRGDKKLHYSSLLSWKSTLA